MKSIVVGAGLLLLTCTAVAESDEQGQIVREVNTRNLFFTSQSTLTIEPRSIANVEVRRLVRAKAQELKVPEALALAVTHVESRFRCDAVGPRTRHGHAYGPLQILASSAARLGYTGSVSALRSCGAGLHYGMLHLAQCWGMSGGSYKHAAHCHVQGPGRNPAVPVNAYAASYGRLILAQVPQAMTNGWLVRGSVEVVSVFNNTRDFAGG
jgi:hypothetical protein